VRVSILGSGSRGNAVVFESAGSAVMVDAGFGVRSLAARLRAAHLSPHSVELLVLTHDHLDHVYGAGQAAAKWGWPVAGTAGTLEAATLLGTRVHLVVGAAASIQSGDLTVSSFRVAHDAADPVAVLVESRSSGARAGLLYDLGETSAALEERFRELDILLLEANHDTAMLWGGRYPPSVKKRIAGRTGHLSNDQAAAFAAAVAHKGLKRVVLCHVSQNNNTPPKAWAAVSQALRRTTFRGSVGLARQDGVTAVRLGGRLGSEQLSLGI
jgi:phosphoribosyl 1,2-cyclic phosphodiesterase